MRQAWQSSNRRAELPSDWGKRRRTVKARARGRCQATTHVPECDGIGAECDHIDSKHDHSPSNLQWLSKACHQAKTQAEAKAGTRLKARKSPRTEPHPGRIA